MVEKFQVGLVYLCRGGGFGKALGCLPWVQPRKMPQTWSFLGDSNAPEGCLGVPAQVAQVADPWGGAGHGLSLLGSDGGGVACTLLEIAQGVILHGWYAFKGSNWT